MFCYLYSVQMCCMSGILVLVKGGYFSLLFFLSYNLWLVCYTHEISGTTSDVFAVLKCTVNVAASDLSLHDVVEYGGTRRGGRGPAA